MTRFIPAPRLALLLFLLWLVLSQEYSPGAILLGGLVAIGGTWAMAALRLKESHIRRPMAALRLARSVTFDILRSNFSIGWIIVHPTRQATSGFLSIPLELEDPNGLAILSCILTANPGTVWVSYDKRARTLLLHILDLVDEETWIRRVKERYERPLMEVFA